jgi:dolichol-phosphate mannosyltransferase
LRETHEGERRIIDKLVSKVAVVIPTLNEAEGIGKVLDELYEDLTDIDFEVIVVDGYSDDGTDEIAKSKGARVIYQKGRGYGDALRTGFIYVRENLDADVIVMLDADCTYDPKDVPRLVEPIERGLADMVVGDRFPRMERGAMTLINRIGNRLLSWFARRTLKIKIHDTQCGIRAFSGELVDLMNLSCGGMPFATEMLVEAKLAGARILEVPVAYRPRIGRPKLNPIRDGLLILGTIIRLVRDTSPLLFFGVIGFIFIIAGLVLGINVTLEWMRTGSVERIPTLLLTILLIIGGIQFFATGLLADMIKRLRQRK